MVQVWTETKVTLGEGDQQQLMKMLREKVIHVGMDLPYLHARLIADQICVGHQMKESNF